MSDRTYTGQCLCGAVHYESRAAPTEVGYCHCRMCQRTSGSPVLPYASFPLETFSYTRGEPKVYKSSDKGQREFCADCGSQIAFRAAGTPDLIDVNVGTLDDPEAVEPAVHIWCKSRVSWFVTPDTLPEYPEAAPGHEQN